MQIYKDIHPALKGTGSKRGQAAKVCALNNKCPAKIQGRGIWARVVDLPSGLNLYLRLNNSAPAESFLKGCTWVYWPFRVILEQTQTCRQWESKKQNNMHYSWPGCTQRLFGRNWQPDTHSLVSNSNSWQKLKISRWGSVLVWMHLCVFICVLLSIYCRCVHISKIITVCFIHSVQTTTTVYTRTKVCLRTVCEHVGNTPIHTR